ncbi:hypothetical protein Aperf_G00000037775 [Anoplocephala perfoliata]
MSFKFDGRYFVEPQMRPTFTSDVPLPLEDFNQSLTLKNMIVGSQVTESAWNLPAFQNPAGIGIYLNFLINSMQNQPLSSAVKDSLVERTLASSIRDLISKTFHLSDRSDLAIRGSLTLAIPGEFKPITLTFSDSLNSETSSQEGLTPSKRKAYRPVKFTRSPSPPSSTSSKVTHRTLHSESNSPSPAANCALDLSKGATVPSPAQGIPVRQEQSSVNAVMKLFQHNSFPTNFQSLNSLPTMLSTMRYESKDVLPSPIKRRRVGGSSLRKSNVSRQFRCNLCGDLFNSLLNLEIHTREVHGGYKCHVCDSKFTQRSNLQRHALKHVDFKPFECSLCERAYYRKDHLMRHMQKSHPHFSAQENIRVKLTSSESLEYLRQTFGDKSVAVETRQDNNADENQAEVQVAMLPEGGEIAITRSDIFKSESPAKSLASLSEESNLPCLEESALPNPLP